MLFSLSYFIGLVFVVGVPSSLFASALNPSSSLTHNTTWNDEIYSGVHSDDNAGDLRISIYPASSTIKKHNNITSAITLYNEALLDGTTKKIKDTISLNPDSSTRERIIGVPLFLRNSEQDIIGIGYFCTYSQEPGLANYYFTIVSLSRDEKYIVVKKLIRDMRKYSQKTRDYYYNLASTNPSIYESLIRKIDYSVVNSIVAKKLSKQIIFDTRNWLFDYKNL